MPDAIDGRSGPGRGRPQPLLSAAAGAALVAHLLALYLPASAGPALLPIPGLDKVVHLAVFAVPVGLLVLLTGRRLLVGGAFAVHAAVSEVVQARFVPGRAGDGWDAVFDLAGIALGLFAAARFRSAARTAPR